jgi:hypothetical protein
MDMSRHCLMLVDTGRYRLKMVVSETMRRGRAVTKRNSGGGANDAQRIQETSRLAALWRCLSSKNLRIYSATPAPSVLHNIILWPDLTGSATP